MKKFSYLLPTGLSIKDIEKVKDKIEYALNGKVEIEQRGKIVDIIVYRGQIPQKINFKLPEKDGFKLGIPIGYTFENQFLMMDMSSDSHCYLLVGGNPGTGKSNFLNQAIKTIVSNYTPEEVILVLIDLKLGVEFTEWEDYPHVWARAYDPETGEIIGVVKKVSKEVRRRLNIFRDTRVRKISEYHAKGYSMPYIFMVIDEYAEIKNDKDIERRIKSLLQIGRASGLRAILATQRPTSDNISGSVKALCTDRICFKVADALNSRVILDTDGAESLPDYPGRAIFLTGAKFYEVQVMKYS